MSNLKRVTVSEKCMLCGICEQKMYSSIFCVANNGKLEVLNSGLVDIDLYPQLLDAHSICPVHAIRIEDDSIASGSKNDAIKKLNDLIYKNLRDYPFLPPQRTEYEYKTGVYHASKIPAQYKSTAKYKPEDRAEAAGLKEFKAAVWSQYKSIAKQYIVEYRVKQLKKYYYYEENSDNYYFSKNKEIEGLLSEAVQLSKFITDEKIILPEDFCRFHVEPDWGYEGFDRDLLLQLENVNFDYEHAQGFYTAEWYSSWIKTIDCGDGESYYYDFEEAEALFRKDMDNVVDSVLYKEVPSRIKKITANYLADAKRLLLEKTDLLQKELKKHAEKNQSMSLKQELDNLSKQISKSTFPALPILSFNMDLAYNNDYRFYSEGSCREAAGNRRSRAYNDGYHFIRNLPDTINQMCMEQLKDILIQWKRQVLQMIDICGSNLPEKKIQLEFPDSSLIQISFNNNSDVSIPTDTTIKNYIDKEILHYGASVGNVKYMSEYSCEINTFEDYDLKETIFGNFKEVNRRYSYQISIHEFEYSAYLVGKACVEELQKSDYLKQYYQNLKQQFIRELRDLEKVGSQS